MMRITTDPLEWITGAIGNIVSTLLFFYVALSLGACTVTDYLSDAFIGSLMTLPISLFTGWGLITIPLSIWIFWALLFEVHNRYVLLSITMFIGFVNQITLDGWWNFHWYTLPLLLAPITVLYHSWINVFSEFNLKFRQWKRAKHPQLSLNPLDWFTSAIGHTLTSILFICITFTLGYISTASDFYIVDIGFCGIMIPELFSSLWVLILLPISGWILWALVFEQVNSYVLYALNIITGACAGWIFEGYYVDETWYTLPILLPASFILVLTVYPKIHSLIHWNHMRKYKGINFDSPEI